MLPPYRVNIRREFSTRRSSGHGESSLLKLNGCDSTVRLAEQFKHDPIAILTGVLRPVGYPTPKSHGHSSEDRGCVVQAGRAAMWWVRLKRD